MVRELSGRARPRLWSRRAATGVLRRLRTARQDDAGVVAILVVIMSTLLFSLAAIVVDLGLARAQRARAQVAADAGALAAADLLTRDPSATLAQAADVAKRYVDANLAEPMQWAACDSVDARDVVADQGACVSFDDATPTLVRVYAVPPRQEAIFGALLGADGYQVSGVAEALVPRESSETCPTEGCLRAPADEDLARPDGQPVVPYAPEPLALLPLGGDVTGCPRDPGVYRNIVIGDESCTLDEGGVYVVTGTLQLGPKAMLAGDFVTVVLACADPVPDPVPDPNPVPLVRACAPEEPGGRVDGDPLAEVTLTGPLAATTPGQVAGFALTSDPLNAAPSRLGVNWTLQGAYVPVGEEVSPPPQSGLTQ